MQLYRWRHTGLTITINPVHNQLELPTTDETDSARFWIDEGSFPILADEEGNYRLTGKELRELVEGAEEIWQWVEDPLNGGGPKRELVEDSALITLTDGDRFTVESSESESEQDGDGEPLSTLISHNFEGEAADKLEELAKQNGFEVERDARVGSRSRRPAGVAD